MTEESNTNSLGWLREKIFEFEEFFGVVKEADEGKSDRQVNLFRAEMEFKLREELFETALAMLEDGFNKEKAYEEAVEAYSELGFLGLKTLRNGIEMKQKPFNSEFELLRYLKD